MEGIVGSIFLGREIQIRFPDIGKAYSLYTATNNKTLDMLVEEYSILHIWPVSMSTARTAVYYAIKGYDGHLKTIEAKPYAGLLSKKAYAKAVAEKKHLHNIKNGNSAKKDSNGIHGLSHHKHSLDAKSGHKKAGHHVYGFKEKALLLRTFAKKEFWRKRGNDVVLQYSKVMEYLNTKANEFAKSSQTVPEQSKVRAFIGGINTGQRKLFAQTHKRLWEKVLITKQEVLRIAT